MNSTIIRRSPLTLSKIPSCCRPVGTTSRLAATPFLRSATTKYTAPIQSRIQPAIARRSNSSLTVPESEEGNPANRPPAPAYQLTFTCKPCKHRSSHTVTKQGYHHGTVLITCPDCKSRHVISDHLNIFMDEKSTLEDILARKNAGGDLTKLLKKGRLGQREGQLVGNEGEEDIEFWEDGSETKHTSNS